MLTKEYKYIAKLEKDTKMIENVFTKYAELVELNIKIKTILDFRLGQYLFRTFLISFIPKKSGG
ncbi:MAG: hypothetical protein ABIK78_03370 [candidate division WOR-3 bacterium]